MSTELLEAALRDAGVDARVEVRGKLVVLASASLKPDAASRRRIVALAQEHGFTNVALEIVA